MQTALTKPGTVFNRDNEWAALATFLVGEVPGARLGVVSGRRRQGKTYLLRALCQAADGFYFAADQATDGESLRRMGMALAEHAKLPAPLRFESWHDVLDALLALGRDRAIPVVIDEFPYLATANPSLPSIVQNALAPLRAERDDSRTRLLLCGSAMSFMGRLLAGNAPLRGRAGLELIVHTLDHRMAARFWGIDDPKLAMKVHAIVGGTPAYRREFVSDDVPTGPDDFDPWVQRTVLNRTSPLFREARYLLADELDIHDGALYHSVLAAIADGNATRGGIASYLGRKSGDLSHPLTVLEDAGLVSREPDAFRDNRTTYRIAEPLVSFYHAIMRPIWSDLEYTQHAAQLWQRSQHRYAGNVLGPHFEHVCRYWTRHWTPAELWDDHPSWVGSGTVHDPKAKTGHQVDTVVFGPGAESQRRLLAIGEAKWGDVMDMGHLTRLRHIRGLLTAQGRLGSANAKLACYSGVGFTEELEAEAARVGDVVLVGLPRLYT